MSGDPPSTKRAIRLRLDGKGGGDAEKPPIHTCSYFLIRAIPRAEYASNGLRDE